MRKITYSVAQLRALYHPSQPPINFKEYEEVVGSTKTFSPFSFSEQSNFSKINPCNHSTQNFIKRNSKHISNQNNLTKSQNFINSSPKSALNWEPTNNHKMHQNSNKSKNDIDDHYQSLQNEHSYSNESYNSIPSEIPNNNNQHTAQGAISQQQQFNLQNNISQESQPNLGLSPIQQAQSPYFMPPQYVNPMMIPFNSLQIQQINLMQPIAPYQLITPYPQMISGVPCQVPPNPTYMSNYHPNYNTYLPYDAQPFTMQTNFPIYQQPPPQPFCQGYPASSSYYQPNDISSMNFPDVINDGDGGSNFPQDQQKQYINNNNVQYQDSFPDNSEYYHHHHQPLTNSNFQQQQNQENYSYSEMVSQENNTIQNDAFDSVLNSNRFISKDPIPNTNFNYDNSTVQEKEHENPKDFNYISTNEKPIIESFESVLNASLPNQSVDYGNPNIMNRPVGNFIDSNYDKNSEEENYLSSSSSSAYTNPFIFIPGHPKEFSSLNKENVIHLNENNNNNNLDEFSVMNKNHPNEKIQAKKIFNPEKLTSPSYYASPTSDTSISQAAKPSKRNKHF